MGVVVEAIILKADVDSFAFLSKPKEESYDVVITALSYFPSPASILFNHILNFFYVCAFCIESWYNMWVSIHVCLCCHLGRKIFNGRLGKSILNYDSFGVLHLGKLDYSRYGRFWFDFMYELALSILICIVLSLP